MFWTKKRMWYLSLGIISISFALLRRMGRVFGCWHRRCSFPMTLKGEKVPHVTCLDCGTRMAYNRVQLGKVGA